MEWDLETPSAFEFYDIFYTIGFSWESDRILKAKGAKSSPEGVKMRKTYARSTKLSKNVEKLVKVMLRITVLASSEFSSFSPLILFSSCLSAARKLMLVKQNWNYELIQLLQIHESEFQACEKKLMACLAFLDPER